MPYLRNSQLHRYLSSPIETLLSTSLDHSVCIAMPAPMVSEQRSNKNNLTVPSDPSSRLAEQLSLMNGIRPPWNSKPDASYGVSVAFAATYLACSSLFPQTTSVSNKSAKQAKASPACNAGWSSFQRITTASHTGEDEIMPTLTSSPASQSPLLRKTFRVLPP